MIKRFLWLPLILALVIACDIPTPPETGEEPPVTPLAPQSTPVLIPVYTTAPLTPANGQEAVELTALFDRGAGPVAALAFTPDGQELLAVHGLEGMLRRWRLEDKLLSSALDVEPVGMAAVALDRQARFLAVGGGKTDPAVQAGYNAAIENIHLWDTRSGELIFETLEGKYMIPATDVTFSFDSRWIAIVTPGGLDIYTTEGDNVHAQAIGLEPKKDYSRTSITAVTFDPSGNWMFWADDTGFVVMEGWKESGWWVVDRGVEEATPLALSVDPTRSRLAAMTTSSLIMWDLGESRLNNLILKEPIPYSPVANLDFSPNGSLLAVGTASGWQIWSVKDRELLVKNDQVAAYAVAFSPDGQLFAWGDVEGVVHIWGVPEK